MKTKNLTELTENLDLKSKLAILGIIDLKVESDMEKVMNKLDSMEHKMMSIQDSMEHKMVSIQDSIKMKMNTVMWVISILTMLGFILNKIKF
jgi:transcriptional regulator of NAD metabolism